MFRAKRDFLFVQIHFIKRKLRDRDHDLSNVTQLLRDRGPDLFIFSSILVSLGQLFLQVFFFNLNVHVGACVHVQTHTCTYDMASWLLPCPLHAPRLYPGLHVIPSTLATTLSHSIALRKTCGMKMNQSGIIIRINLNGQI